MKKHLLTVGTIAAVLGMFHYLNVLRHPVYRHAGPPIAANEKARKFATATFLPVEAEDFWSGLEDRFVSITSTNGPNSEHSEALLPQIRRFLECYSKDTDFESYVDFRTAGVPYELSLTGVSGLMKDAATNKGLTFPSNTLDSARMVWQLATEGGEDKHRTTITDVSLERMSVFIMKTSGAVSPLFAVAYHESGAPQAQYPTLVICQETPKQIRKKQGAVWYAVVGLPCKVNHDPDFSKAHYLHVSFFWSDKYQSWVPSELYDDAPFKLPATLAQLSFPESFTFPLFF